MLNLVRLGTESVAFLALENICDGRTFILEHSDSGRDRQVKQQIVDLALNESASDTD